MQAESRGETEESIGHNDNECAKTLSRCNRISRQHGAEQAKSGSAGLPVEAGGCSVEFNHASEGPSTGLLSEGCSVEFNQAEGPSTRHLEGHLNWTILECDCDQWQSWLSGTSFLHRCASHEERCFGEFGAVSAELDMD